MLPIRLYRAKVGATAWHHSPRQSREPQRWQVAAASDERLGRAAGPAGSALHENRLRISSR